MIIYCSSHFEHVYHLVNDEVDNILGDEIGELLSERGGILSGDNIPFPVGEKFGDSGCISENDEKLTYSLTMLLSLRSLQSLHIKFLINILLEIN